MFKKSKTQKKLTVGVLEMTVHIFPKFYIEFVYVALISIFYNMYTVTQLNTGIYNKVILSDHYLSVLYKNT